MKNRKRPLFGPCIPLLICGAVLASLLQPVEIRVPRSFSIVHFIVPIGAAIGFLVGVIVEKLDEAIARRRGDPPEDPPL